MNKNSLKEKEEQLNTEKTIKTQILNNVDSKEKETLNSEISKLDENIDNTNANTDSNIVVEDKKLDKNIDDINQIIDSDVVQNNFEPVVPNGAKDKKSVAILILILFIVIIIFSFFAFTIYNIFNSNIINGVSVKGIDFSNTSPSDAKYQLENYLKNALPQEIKLKHGDFEASISLEQIGVNFNVK